MRVDIDIDEATGEIEELKSLKNATFSASVTSEDASNIFVSVVINDGLEDIIETSGIGIKLGRIDSTKEIQLTVSNVSNTFNTGQLPINKIDGDSLIASELPTINDDFAFVVIYSSVDANFTIYSGYTTDLSLVQSMAQNEYLLITMDKGNLYEEPLLGVGIKDYLNTNIEDSDVGQQIKSVFESDGMIVKQVNYDTSTGEIITQTQEAE